jgi:putative transposase
LVASGQKAAAAAKVQGIVKQTLANSVKAEKAGQLPGGKSHGVLCEGAAMKYAWIEKNKLLWRVCAEYRVLGVSASGCRQHRARRKKIFTRCHLSETALLVENCAVYTESRGACGWPRVWRQLKASGVRVGKCPVQRAMQRAAIQARGKRRFRVVTTDSNHALPIAPNLLARHFTVAEANTVWAGDTTYIPPAKAGCAWPWCWTCSAGSSWAGRWARRLRRGLACRALDMAWYSRSPVSGLIFHSRRGSQYASRSYTALLAGHGIKASMSRKGNCWDTQSNIFFERQLDLTLAGIGQAAFALTCRSRPACSEHYRAQPQ